MPTSVGYIQVFDIVGIFKYILLKTLISSVKIEFHKKAQVMSSEKYIIL